MDHTFFIGIAGAIVLVCGAAFPSRPVRHPRYSLKNWLFAIGGLLMLAYSSLNFLAGGPIFFVILQLFVNLASVLMMLNTKDRFDATVLSLGAIGFVAWSLALYQGASTILFILGLTGIGLGYAFKAGTIRRDASLAAGSVLIALFSYLGQSWIFFWLNVFFAGFSLLYVWKGLRKN